MINVVYKKYNKKRHIPNRTLGSTIAVTNYPQFKNPTSGLYSTLPRQYETCPPKGTGQWFMKRKWF